MINEQSETLFFIVHDEAHFAPKKHNMVDMFINDPAILKASNVILLQVSATPYCLVTKNSRIPEENCINWFTKEDSSNYFGIQERHEKNEYPITLLLVYITLGICFINLCKKGQILIYI